MDKNRTAKQENSFMIQRRQILNESSSFATREAYRTLRTNIRFALKGKECKSFCITSAARGEGKSITILNLAITFAEAGHKILLIDADMRRPTLARLLVEKAAPGLSNVLASLTPMDKAVRQNIRPNLDILFSGDIPPNPSELLGSEQMAELVRSASERYDYILVDVPPVNVVSDTCVVANLLDGVLLLVRQGRSRKDSVRRSINNLNLTGATVLGCVFNSVPTEGKSAYYYSYYE